MWLFSTLLCAVATSARATAIVLSGGMERGARVRSTYLAERVAQLKGERYRSGGCLRLSVGPDRCRSVRNDGRNRCYGELRLLGRAGLLQSVACARLCIGLCWSIVGMSSRKCQVKSWLWPAAGLLPLLSVCCKALALYTRHKNILRSARLCRRCRCSRKGRLSAGICVLSARNV